MSHADDGTLHAYLDGELSALERAGLETHLAGCAACRARLEEERDLLERAQGLLARAAPPAASLPPRRRAGGAGIARPLPRWLPLAWAASVLLALGGGWLARGRSPSGAAVLAPTAESMTVAVGDAEQSRSAIPAATITPESAAAPTPVINGSTGTVYGDRAPAPARREDVAVQGKAAAEAQERDAQVAAQPTAGASADRFAASPESAGRIGENAITRGGAPTRAAAPAAPPSFVIDGTVAGAVAGADPAAFSTVSLDSARTILQSEPVAISELPVRSVQASAAGVVVIEQPLSSTFTIRLYQRRAESPNAPPRQRALARAPSLERPARETELLARYVGPLRVEISGPVSADSLSRLLGMVVPIR
jgi:hypothetical protein